MKFVIEIDPNKVYDSMEKAKNFLNNNPNLITSFQKAKITIILEEDA